MARDQAVRAAAAGCAGSVLRRRPGWLVLGASAALLCATLIACAVVGPVSIPPGTVIGCVASRIPLVGRAMVRPWWTKGQEVIVVEVRLPRVVLAMLVGASLSAAGAAFQGIIRNPLADPYLIGVSSGAALGASVAIVFGVGAGLGVGAGTAAVDGGASGTAAVPVVAFCCAVGTMLLVYSLARTRGRIPVDTFVLAGVVVGSVVWAAVTFIMAVAGERLHEVMFWLMGSLSGRTWRHVAMCLPYSAVGLAALVLLAPGLNLLSMGEETAQHLGLDVERFKLMAIGAASLVTAASVSTTGVIGFVGLVVPHCVRLVIGPDHRLLIPCACMAGGAFLVAADTLARTIVAPAELPVGVVTAVVGGPFFLYLLRARKRRGVF